MASLRELWAELRGAPGSTGGGGFRLRLLETHGETRVFAAVSEASSTPALVVEIPLSARPRSEITAVTRTFESLIADFSGLSPGRVGIAVVLRDPTFEDLFAVLGEEIVTMVRLASGTGEAARAVGRCIARWRRFTEHHHRGLSDEEVQGLVGELVVLSRCIGRLGPRVAVAGWTGPEDALRDFELPNASIEVKTYRSDSGATVRINDPQQLDDEGVRPVYLASVRVAKLESSGRRLPEFIARTAALITDESEAADLFDERLAACGYLPVHASSYTDHFVAEKVSLYHVRPGFPRVRASEIPAGVLNVHFSIQLAALGEFEVAPEQIIGAPSFGLEGASR